MKASTDRPSAAHLTHAGADTRELIAYLLNRASGRFNQVWRTRLREHGVTVARWQVLAILSEFDGARLGQLAAMAAVEQPVMSRVVDQMERDGLVRRRSVNDDGRAVEVRLTGRGRDMFVELAPEAAELTGAALEGLDDVQVAALGAALVQVASNLESLGASKVRS
jgi:DNA-binding MarR family transcriptional regulator